jgi:hypothetical protein
MFFSYYKLFHFEKMDRFNVSHNNNSSTTQDLKNCWNWKFIIIKCCIHDVCSFEQTILDLKLWCMEWRSSSNYDAWSGDLLHYSAHLVVQMFETMSNMGKSIEEN